MHINTAQKSSPHSLLILISMLALMIGFLTYLYLQNQQLEKLANYQPLTTSPNPTPTQIPTSLKTSPLEVLVTVSVDGFTPATLIVKKGSLVTFLNLGKKDYQIYSDPHPSHAQNPLLNFDEPLTNNSSITVIFDKAGVYTFHEESNPLKHKGTIKVE